MEIATRIYERHELIRKWLIKIGVPEETAAQDACKMEHDLSVTTFDRMKEYISRLWRNDRWQSLKKPSTSPLSQTIVRVENAVMNGSATASLEERSEFTVGNARIAIRVYERYSAFGGNRVSMSVTMASAGETTKVVAVTSGGSQAMFFKLNTVGEENFLDTLRDAL